MQRFAPTDNFGVVAFDERASVVVPTGPLTDKARVVAPIADIHPGGMTDLSAGYLRSLREPNRVEGSRATLLVISDGDVNSDVRDHDQFAGLAAHALIAGGTMMIELGDFYAAEQRKQLMTFQVPAMASPGLAQIASLELGYVELPGLVEHTVTVPISVSVGPGDEAAARAEQEYVTRMLEESGSVPRRTCRSGRGSPTTGR